MLARFIANKQWVSVYEYCYFILGAREFLRTLFAWWWKHKIKFKAWPNKNSRCLHTFSLLLKHDRLFCKAHRCGAGAKVKLITLFISFLTAKILHNFSNFSLCTAATAAKVNRQKIIHIFTFPSQLFFSCHHHRYYCTDFENF